MIVSRVSDPLLQQALRTAAHPEEEVVTDAPLVVEALLVGFPRLLVRSGAALREPSPPGVRVLDLDDLTLRRWEAERRSEELPAPRLDDLARRLRILTQRSSAERTWADVAIADLGRAAGMPLPPTLRTFARRVFEFPSRYTSLHDLAEACGLSRGALKARFRRRELASPYTYLRWFRLMAVAEMLSDRDVTVARAAHRLGFTSAGNLCRATAAMADTTPTELRTVRGWNRLVVRFAWIHLTPEALEGWRGLALFRRRRRVA
jgi:AraC-like DNA-binding protein